MANRTFAILFASIFLAGCATTAGTGWTDAPATTLLEKAGSYSIDIPAGWLYRYNKSKELGNAIIATRDGPGLQRIVVVHRRNDKAFPSIEREAAPEMLAQELAERFVANFATGFEQDVVDVLVSEPATLSATNGFRVYLQFRVGELRYQMIAHGVSTADGYFTMSYAAPVLHYFERDLDTFARTVKTFRLRKTPAAGDVR